MTLLPFVDRPPTAAEIERIRLILSTYQDGTGMLSTPNGTLPGWRDFERAVAVSLGGEAQENKAVFDVVLSAPAGERRPQYGVSCKMRRELDRLARDGRVTVELSNAAGEFWGAVEATGAVKGALGSSAHAAGCAIGSVVNAWHQAVCHSSGGAIDLSRSCYLVLLWNRHLQYQMFQFGLDLWDAGRLAWSVADGGRRLCGQEHGSILVEWYFDSGGQLKVYPLATRALWRSEVFTLEPLPAKVEPISGKAASYFPDKWAAVADTKTSTPPPRPARTNPGTGR